MTSLHDIARSELPTWRARRHPGAFPFDAVVAPMHAVGKHFVGPELLRDLDRAGTRFLADAPPTVSSPGFSTPGSTSSTGATTTPATSR